MQLESLAVSGETSILFVYFGGRPWARARAGIGMHELKGEGLCRKRLRELGRDYA